MSEERDLLGDLSSDSELEFMNHMMEVDPTPEQVVEESTVSPQPKEVPSRPKATGEPLNISAATPKDLPEGAELTILRLPRTVKLEPDAYVPTQADSRAAVPGMTFIRWRMVNGIPQSNARIVRWSDGSEQLLIGDESFNVKKVQFNHPEERHELYAKVAENCSTRMVGIQSKSVVQPTTIKASASRIKVQELSVGEKRKVQQSMFVRDVEKEKADLKEYYEREKAKNKELRLREMEDEADRSFDLQSNANYLEAFGSDEEEDDWNRKRPTYRKDNLDDDEMAEKLEASKSERGRVTRKVRVETEISSDSEDDDLNIIASRAKKRRVIEDESSSGDD